MPMPLGYRETRRADEGRFTGKRQDKKYGDALGPRVRCGNGRMRPMAASKTVMARLEVS